MDRGLKANRSDFRPAIRAGGSGQLGRDGLADESDDALAIGMYVRETNLVCFQRLQTFLN